MDDVRAGRLLRELRRRRRWRQVDVAHAAGISQSAVSLIERGHLDSLSLRVLRRVFGSVDARFDGDVSWRGGLADRLLDERHARLVGTFTAELVRLGWDTHLEVSFSEYGERGSIDILASRPPAGVILVVEIKSELMALDDTIRRLDIKQRLAAKIAFDRFGWRPSTVARLLVVEEAATSRRRVAAHAYALGAAFPARGSAVRGWLRQPSGTLSGLRFFSSSNRGGSGQVERVARRRNQAPSSSPTSPGGR